MTVFECLQLMLGFGVFLVGLIQLVVVLIKQNNKK